MLKVSAFEVLLDLLFPFFRAITPYPDVGESTLLVRNLKGKAVRTEENV
jgi:hypothetical protein